MQSQILLLALTVVIAAGSVLAGAVAGSGAFWVSAAAIFGLACMILLAFTARQLGVVPDVERLLSMWRGKGKRGKR